ncbi:MAG: DUF3347 domain-containing protein [Ignavibacteria bacterium]|nr:DUF3347 domain-containing protein [Ignavibacteria bacterium]MBK7447388.1 DUF3347 domain-containing protein [Ignavibacteria bacterium]MBK9406115.1 DUF3347 domain-containing protein [Ignavibacteria bacterium]
MKKLFWLIIICICKVSLFADVKSSQAAIIVPGDSVIFKRGIYQLPESEVEIVFDESNLAPKNVRMIFNELFKQYILVKDALVYGDSFSATRNTLKLLDDMKSKTKDLDDLNKDARWVLFIKNYDRIRSKAESTTFISEQRFLFNEITNGLQNFIKQFGLYNKTIYLMQCSSDSSAGNSVWFSGSRDKKNPYLGLQNDTTCAKVKEVWKF